MALPIIIGFVGVGVARFFSTCIINGAVASAEVGLGDPIPSLIGFFLAGEMRNTNRISRLGVCGGNIIGGKLTAGPVDVSVAGDLRQPDVGRKPLLNSALIEQGMLARCKTAIAVL